MTVAALFVEENGVYAGIPGVEVWGVSRDARKYAGPHPVAAHPPCERWGRYWFGGPSAKVRREKGDDGHCFVAALNAVRKYGGVLEHPADSSAWAAYGINRPPRSGEWVEADSLGGWTCEVEQGHYGHRARKRTWLYYVGSAPPPRLRTGPSTPAPSVNSTPQVLPPGRRATRTGICQRMSRKQRLTTPVEFRDDVMLSLARSVSAGQEGAKRRAGKVPKSDPVIATPIPHGGTET